MGGVEFGAQRQAALRWAVGKQVADWFSDPQSLIEDRYYDVDKTAMA